MAFIYKITNKVNGKIYIGQTKRNYKERWYKHKNFNSPNYKCPILKQAFIKYGVENFIFEVIEECSEEERLEKEKNYIIEYDCIAPKGYNFLPGGFGGGFLNRTHTEETKEKISLAGKKFREENPDYYETYREKHIEATKNANISERTKNSVKFQLAVKEGRVGSGLGNKLPEEAKEKIRKSVIKYYEEIGNGNKCNIEKHRAAMTKAMGKRIGQYELNGVIMIEEFPSIAEAVRQTNIGKSNIGHNLKGKNKTAGGFIWKYLD
jgi:group I intron endonuclease